MSLQNNSLLISLTFLALLSLNAMAFPLLGRKNLQMNAHAGSSGIIELKKDANNFYVEADLNTYPFGSSKNSTNSLQISDSVKMMISLSNDETLVTANCLNFTSYNCTKYHCHNEDWGTNLSFPSFNASVQAAEGYIYLDYLFWGLETANLYIAQSCQTGNYSPPAIGLDRYGVLGLGTGNGSASNFMSSELFSVYIKPDLTGGKLLFKNDASTYAKSSSEPIYTLNASSSWQTNVSNATLQFSNTSINLTADNLIFDINSDVIGLPSKDFTSLEWGLLGLNIQCNFVPGQPTTCLFLDKVFDLPDITLSLNNKTNLTIPAAIYSTPFRKCDGFTCFTLKFKAIGSTQPSNSYVSPAFNNSIILDANFMSYYYTVFDANTTSGSNLIYLYQAGKSTPDDGGDLNAVVGGIIAAAFLIVICYCASKKRRVESDKNDSTQAPLVYSSYDQPQTVYNAGYQQPQGTTTIGYGQNN